MLIRGTAFSIPLKNESVHCCITSPPYWSLRKYAGLGENQFGLEKTLGLYIEHSMAVLDEVWRVLRKDGTCWWNLGDSYASNGCYINSFYEKDENKNKKHLHTKNRERYEDRPAIRDKGLNIKPKDLCLVPYRFALAAQQRGWWIRSAIIWAKPNPMPESCTDRPTDAYEHIFLMTKAKNYWYDAEAVREKSKPESIERVKSGWHGNKDRNDPSGNNNNFDKYMGSERALEMAIAGRNLRNVWEFPTQSFSGAHFATFPEELPRRCILAGCPEKTCGKCGAGYVRVLEKERLKPAAPSGNSEIGRWSREDSDALGGRMGETKTLGWKPSCDCGTKETAKGVCLDPFAGSGTVVDVAVRSGRQGIGIELSEDYIKLAQKRTENSRTQTRML